MDEIYYLENLLPQVRCIEIDLHTDDEGYNGQPIQPMGSITLEAPASLNLNLRDKVLFKVKWQVETIERIEDKHLGGKNNSIEYDNNYYRYKLEPVKVKVV